MTPRIKFYLLALPAMAYVIYMIEALFVWDVNFINWSSDNQQIYCMIVGSMVFFSLPNMFRK
jgi:hypothetical protein